jgi:hypothetical protein
MEYIFHNKSSACICREQSIHSHKLKALFVHYQIQRKPVGSHCITSQEEKINKILQQHPFATKEFMQEQYAINQKSLPDLMQEFKINYDQTKKLLEYYEIQMRGISQAAKTNAFKTKLHATLKDKYGAETNISQSAATKQKKAEKCLTEFGVDNFFKRHDFKKIKEEGFQQRYGMSCSEWRSLCSSEVWNNKSEEERQEWLDKSINSDAARTKSIKGYRESKGEAAISDALAALQITHTRQFIIKYEEEGKKRRYFYDLFISELNLLIEFNGDYWHANPALYNAEDVLNYPSGQTTAAERWKKDERKKAVALERKYAIIVVWEKEINNLTNEQLIKLIQTKIYAKSKN